MTDDLYQKIKRNGRREVLERSYLTVRVPGYTGSQIKEHGCSMECNRTGEAKSTDWEI